MNTSRTPKPIVGLFLFIGAVLISQLTACGGSSPQPSVPVLKYVQVFPATSTIDIGQAQQFTAWGTYSDGTSKDISNLVTWSSSNQTVATVSSSGLALGNSQGDSTISATLNNGAGPVTGTATLGVAATLMSLTITPVNSFIAISTSLQLTATGIFSDGSTQDLTASASWSSSSSGVATVNSSGVVTGTGAGSTTITATQGGVSASTTTTVTVTSAVLTSITITPPSIPIAKSTSQQLVATGNFSDGTTQNLTAFVTWSSSAPSVVAVSNTAPSQGLVTGIGVGSATVSATLAGVSGTTTVTVTPAVLTSIVVIPANRSIAQGSSLQLTATGVFSDRTTQNLTASASWSSSADPIATVSSSGLVRAAGVGNATITATEAGVSGTTTVTVTAAVLTAITITPPDSSIAVGTSEQLIATGDFSDGTTQNLTAFVTWVSSAPSLATVSNAPGSQGLVTGSGVGSATITATLEGVSGTTTVTVTPAVLASIVITPPNPSLAKGTSEQLTATGTFSDGTTQDFTASASWISSSDTIATVANTVNPGLVTGTGVGSATITATLEGVSGTTTVTVTPAVLTSIVVTPPNPSLAKGTSEQLTATGTFSDGTTQDFTASASWISSSDTIATVANTVNPGLVTGTGVGSATITATLEGVSGTTTVTVTPAVLTSIVVTPPNPSLAKGTSEQLTATGTFSDGTTQDFTASASWISSSDTIATVANTVNPGLVTGTGIGSATITATGAGVSGATTVTVTAAVLTAITITPPNSSIAVGTSEQLIATGDFSDGTTQNLTGFVSWVSSAPSLATVSNAPGSQGLVTGSGVGSATITATLEGVSGTTTVTVTPPVLTSIVVTPPNPSLAKGTSVAFTALGIFSDGTAQDVTTSASWVSSSDAIATVTNAINPALVTGTGVGSATITATQEGVSGATTVMVTPAILTSIVVTPVNASIAKGTTAQLTATGTFSDETTEDLTASASWISTSDSIATVGNTGSPGLVTGTGVGSATITATQGGVSGTSTVSVTAAVLTSIAVTPANPSIADGTTVQLTATGTFSDSTTQDLTASASWISSSDTIATVANTVNPGLVTGTGIGSATITATQENVSGATTVTVGPVTIIGTWTPFGSLNTGRTYHTASLRPDGTVLVAGGFNSSGALNSAEISNPVTETWSSAPPMATRRFSHTSTTLPDGRVLVVGGVAANGTSLNSVEIFSTVWSPAAPTKIAHSSHTATLLNDGRVLVAGGYSGGSNATAVAELYDPSADTWTLVAPLNAARGSHTATLLADGRVLVAGGDQGGAPLASAEVYDPIANTWTLTYMSRPRIYHTASLLPDGSVLVAGGTDSSGIPTNTVELFHPDTMSWQRISPMTIRRDAHTATVMPNGQVVVAGGSGLISTLSSVEIFDPTSRRWLPAASMANARKSHTATLMPDGRLLVVGGLGAGYLASSELFDMQ